jgi:hypothetical protein
MTATDCIISAGHRYSLLAAALVKKCLQQKLSDAERLDFLEMLDHIIDTYITPEMLALVQPMSDAEVGFVEEADKLVAPDDKLVKAKFDLLTSEKVFGWFVQLNPSLDRAIQFREQQFSKPAPQPTVAGQIPAAPVRYGQDEIPDRFVASSAAPQPSHTLNLHTGK